jgi:hypothetical protein
LSETIERDNAPEFVIDNASEDDVRRTLEELKRTTSDLEQKRTKLERELASERTRRLSLESDLGGERAARVTAESERDTHASRAVSEAEQRWIAEKNATTASIAAKEGALEVAEDDYARHAELNDWKEAAKAQRRMATEAAELQALKQRQDWLDSNKEKIVPKQPQPVARIEQPRQAESAPSHRYAALVGGPLVGGEEAWLDARPDFRTDATYRADVIAASQIAGKRHERGSDPYFREIERILGEEPQQTQRRQPEPPARQQPQRGPSADLPPSRRAGPGEESSGGGQPIRLTAEEADIANSLFGDPNRKMSFIPDEGKRYQHYYDMKKRAAGR